MSRIEPLEDEELGEFREYFESVAQATGFKPNSSRIMARRPEILRLFGPLTLEIMRGGTLPKPLKWMAAHLASMAAGCRYCSAHTLSNGHDHGLSLEKMKAVWEYETSPLFNEAERAALRFSQLASQVPVGTTPQDFDDLRRYYDDGEIVELLSVVSLFGFLNRFNDNLDVTLEDKAAGFIEREQLKTPSLESTE